MINYRINNLIAFNSKPNYRDIVAGICYNELQYLMDYTTLDDNMDFLKYLQRRLYDHLGTDKPFDMNTEVSCCSCRIPKKKCVTHKDYHNCAPEIVELENKVEVIQNEGFEWGEY